MAAVRMMKGSGDIVVQVIAVRNSFVAAGSPVRFAALDRRARDADGHGAAGRSVRHRATD